MSRFFQACKNFCTTTFDKTKADCIVTHLLNFHSSSPRNCNFSNSTHYQSFTHIFKITILFFICSFLSLIYQVVDIFKPFKNKRLTQQVYENLYACYYLTNHTPLLYLTLVYQLQRQVEDESKWIYIFIFLIILHL